MNYNEIQKILKEKRISFNSLAEMMEMTNKGLKYSLVNEKLPVDKAKALFKILDITPAEFFGEVFCNGNRVGSTINKLSFENRQNYSDNLDVLQAQNKLLDERVKDMDSQIKEKDRQIKEKDGQIKELLSILKVKLSKSMGLE